MELSLEVLFESPMEQIQSITCPLDIFHTMISHSAALLFPTTPFLIWHRWRKPLLLSLVSCTFSRLESWLLMIWWQNSYLSMVIMERKKQLLKTFSFTTLVLFLTIQALSLQPNKKLWTGPTTANWTTQLPLNLSIVTSVSFYSDKFQKGFQENLLMITQNSFWIQWECQIVLTSLIWINIFTELLRLNTVVCIDLLQFSEKNWLEVWYTIPPHIFLAMLLGMLAYFRSSKTWRPICKSILTRVFIETELEFIRKKLWKHSTQEKMVYLIRIEELWDGIQFLFRQILLVVFISPPTLLGTLVTRALLYGLTVTKISL